jgi:hypothetical protein
MSTLLNAVVMDIVRLGKSIYRLVKESVQTVINGWNNRPQVVLPTEW